MEDIKRNLRLSLDEDFHDQTLLQLIDSATAQAEHDCNLALMQQTWEYRRDHWPRQRWVYIPMRPIIDVVSIHVTPDSDTGEVVWDAANYTVDKARQQIVLADGQSWPAAMFATIRVTVTAGFGNDPHLAPADLRQAIALQVSKWFSNAGMDMNELITGKDEAYERIVGRYMRSSYP